MCLTDADDSWVDWYVDGYCIGKGLGYYSRVLCCELGFYVTG